MKYILTILGIVLAGCSAPLISTTPYNAVIPLDDNEVGIFIPDHWEKVSPEKTGTNIVLMARNGSENVAISFERNETIITGNALCKGAEKSLAFFETVLVDDTQCIFQARPSDNTPLRQFWQKVVRPTNANNFLLMSCSAEQIMIETSQCPEILASFKILDKTE